MIVLLHELTPAHIQRIQSMDWVSLDQYTGKENVLTFDGIYESVYEHRKELAGIPFELFVLWGNMGTKKLARTTEQFLTLDKLLFIATKKNLHWHTRTHPDLRTLSDEELDFEITPAFNTNWFAYPYGEYDERVMQAVKEKGYKGALSVHQGDNSQFALKREEWQ